MAPICPYCREPIDQEEVSVCPDCEIPHHLECWMENNGCTTMGCTQAPPDEPKMTVANNTRGGNLSRRASPSGAGDWAMSARPRSADGPSAHRTTFMLLGLFLGAFGVHNFYAGHLRRGSVQLLITSVTLFYGAVISWPWAIVEVVVVAKDGRGQSMD